MYEYVKKNDFIKILPLEFSENPKGHQVNGVKVQIMMTIERFDLLPPRVDQS